jgi:hypothetical protein
MSLTATESFGKLRDRVQLGKISRARKRNSDIDHADIPEMLITSCRDTQTSADASIGGIYNGAFTYYLVESIKEANGNLTYRELHKLTTAKLKKNDFDQAPQLKGRRSSFERPFLS